MYLEYGIQKKLNTRFENIDLPLNVDKKARPNI